MLERSSIFWSVASLIAVLCAITNLPWTLDHYDQAKQAFTSYEMVNQGHWLYQHTPNEWVATKPPLVGWLSAALYGVTRSWDIAWRLPSFAAALLLLVVLTRNAAHAYGRTAGLIGMSALGLNLLTPGLATLVRTDMPLAFVIFLLGLKIWQKLRDGEPWQRRDRLIVFALLTAAMLIKGPIVYVFLLPGIAAFEWWRRKHGKAVTAWCGWWPWVASLAVFAVWVAVGIATMPAFYELVVLREFAGRFDQSVHRPQPILFYLPPLLHRFAPWSVLLLALAAIAFRERHWRELARSVRPEVAWLICWSLAALAIMSLVPSKRVARIYPIVPPLCLLLAAQLSASRLTPRLRRWTAVALLFAVLFTSGYAAQKVFRAYRANVGGLVAFGAQVREMAAAQGWRYEVVGWREEGMPLYLRRPRFTPADDAVQRWNTGSLDALVVAAEDTERLLSALAGAAPAGVEGSATIDGELRRYLLLVRQPRPAD